MEKVIITRSTPMFDTKEAYTQLGEVMDLLLSFVVDIPDELCEPHNNCIGPKKQSRDKCIA